MNHHLDNPVTLITPQASVSGPVVTGANLYYDLPETLSGSPFRGHPWGDDRPKPSLTLEGELKIAPPQ